MGKGNDGLNGKVEFWAAAMELHGQSGLSCVEFCNREGLAYSTFCRWRDKLSGKAESAEDNPSGEYLSEAAGNNLLACELSKSGTDSNAELSNLIQQESSSDEVKFIPAGVIAAGGGYEAGIEIRFSSGISINVRKGFDRSTFKDVISILGAEL